MKLLGFEIKRESDKEENKNYSFAEPQNDDGALTVGTAVGGSYGVLLDMEGSAKTEAELITKYRGMMLQPEISQAVDEVVNEAISIDSHERVVEIILDDIAVPDKIKKKITEEFEKVLNLLDFSNSGYDIFQKFYVDGRVNYHIMIDEENISEGIQELRYVDARKLRLIREVDNTKKDKHTGVEVKMTKKEYYMYSENGFGGAPNSNNQNQSVTGFRISKDSIARVTSGLMNENNSMVLSWIHPAIKPLNQLRMLEDATVIYTLTRAPERRIFYIDVGNLPKAKAEQYLHDMMTRHKNKLQYDPNTGEVADARKFMTMTEDFWFPRRGGDRSTEVDILAGGSSQALSGDENMQYFQRKLYKSLKVPVSRLEPESMYSFGRVSEISRDELKFSKFIRRLRSRFSMLFDTIMEKQLVLRGVMSPEEWNEIKDSIRYDFMKDNYFEELKQSEILREKLNTLRDVEDSVGKYFSRSWVIKNVLFMSDAEAKEIKSEIKKEIAAGLYSDEMGEFGQDQDQDYDEPDADGESDEDEEPMDGSDIDQAEESLEIINNTKSKAKRKGLGK